VITLFEIVLTMEYLINALYWALLFEPEKLNPEIWATYRGPFINHLTPFILLNIELFLNGCHFNYPGNLKYFIAVTFTYLFVNMFVTFYYGVPVYYFLNY